MTFTEAFDRFVDGVILLGFVGLALVALEIVFVGRGACPP